MARFERGRKRDEGRSAPSDISRPYSEAEGDHGHGGEAERAEGAAAERADCDVAVARWSAYARHPSGGPARLSPSGSSSEGGGGSTERGERRSGGGETGGDGLGLDAPPCHGFDPSLAVAEALEASPERSSRWNSR